MRKISIAAVITIAAIAIWIATSGDSSPSTTSEPIVAAKPDRHNAPIRATSQSTAPLHTASGGTQIVAGSVSSESSGGEFVRPTRIGVRLSSREQRPGERDDIYQTRLSWLDKFASFEKRGNLSAEQRAQLLSVLADLQEEAILSWEATARGAREVTPEERRRAANDPSYEAYPSIPTLEKTLRRDLFEELRTFLTQEQYVSFRRTSRLSAALGYGRWLPLDIETAK